MIGLGKHHTAIILLFLYACESNESSSSSHVSANNDVLMSENAISPYSVYPFQVCSEPIEGDSPQGNEVCAQVSIGGCVEEGMAYEEYVDCNLVRSQRPYYELPPANVASSDDPRLQDTEYMNDVNWAKDQVAACGCVCCHSSKSSGVGAARYDIDSGPIWIDSLTDRGVAEFAGWIDTSILGAFDPSDNNGFDRSITIAPTNNVDRMRAIFERELERRNYTREDLADEDPAANFLVRVENEEPEVCKEGEGISRDGTILWTGGSARYLFIQQATAKNPGNPPNRDLPEGTIWRIAVPYTAPSGMLPGLTYGQVPDMAAQTYPKSNDAPDALIEGETYKLYVLRDIASPLLNCTFTY